MAMSDIQPRWRCQVDPQPHQQFAFSIGGREVTRWHWGEDAPRPYFFPMLGPSGISLTRMGHPGAPNHDHHLSVWFAHHDVLGISFWSNASPARIRQTQWYAIQDGDDAATAAWQLAWLDGHDPAPLLHQEVVTTLCPLADGQGWTLELQSAFQTSAEGVAFRQSNFGILGVRVAKSISRVFGGGTITGADGSSGESELFGRPNRWIDYSGVIGMREGENVVEGICVIDHRENPGHGEHAYAAWHVRDDGWIGPSLSRHADIELLPDQPLVCRYLLVVHAGPCPPDLMHGLADAFDQRPGKTVVAARRAHHQWEIR
ncbi:MAG: hypothetical protein D6753_03290 [Planctomycetota bacterium]|nr:MAG: hypothetical protein D6753_03290 [Planctomycetota bacterium]